MSQKLLSAEMMAVADALRHVRSRLVQLVRDGHWPEGAWPDVSTVQLLGLDVAEVLERLAKGSEPARRTPTHLDERH